MQNTKEVVLEDHVGTTVRPDDLPLPRLGHLPELDGIRGIAALMVFFHHICFVSFNPTGWSYGIVSTLHNLTSVWDAGVDVFFVLSGFLISSLSRPQEPRLL